VNGTKESESENESIENSDVTAAPQEDESFKRNNTRVLLPQKEFHRLWCEGKCFKCKIVKGHLSRNCPQNEQEIPVEVLAAHFAEEENDEPSEDYLNSDDGDRTFKMQYLLEETDLR
jgi:hypothetical protein